MPYKQLRAEPIIKTMDQLAFRIEERFPDSSLRGVARELCEVASRCASEADRLARPNIPIRASVYSIWLIGAVTVAYLAARYVRYGGIESEVSAVVQFLEPAMNLAVLIGIGVVALGRLEDRWKRGRAIKYLHELRSIIHVVDMHQLTKDPYRGSGVLPDTAHSPKEKLSPALLERYLDYCSELAAIAGKLAAMLAQSCQDTEVTHAASDIEQAAGSLSQKIWQKIMVLDRLSKA